MITYLLVSPILAFIVMLPTLALLGEVFGKEFIGDTAIEEFLIVWQIVIILTFFRFFRKRGFTEDEE
jgi:hypothetical protein